MVSFSVSIILDVMIGSDESIIEGCGISSGGFFKKMIIIIVVMEIIIILERIINNFLYLFKHGSNSETIISISSLITSLISLSSIPTLVTSTFILDSIYFLRDNNCLNVSLIFILLIPYLKDKLFRLLLIEEQYFLQATFILSSK